MISNSTPSHQSSTDASNTTTLSPQFEVSQDLETGVVIGRSHRSLGLSPVQMTFNSDVDGNGVQGNAAPLQEPDGSNTNALIRLNTGRMHRREDNKKHKCDVCGNAFRKKYQLDDHMHRHRGQFKSHPCDFPGCNKSFTNRANMRRHHKIHSNTPTIPEKHE
ncbi:hypothetical protein RSOLAG22IIIB_05176 [Rhizoctonia solani]|uniref:C2H2-type domain-containing protein n=1 Tax=Rhizoctonia solani TaxID=456999 RepID=A0A0K6G3S5_9AGAM|nr:hypothetical protein RSOLAG22IIIB_05176 [Rhizoctonia solani]